MGLAQTKTRKTSIRPEFLTTSTLEQNLLLFPEDEERQKILEAIRKQKSENPFNGSLLATYLLQNMYGGVIEPNHDHLVRDVQGFFPDLVLPDKKSLSLGRKYIEVKISRADNKPKLSHSQLFHYLQAQTQHFKKDLDTLTESYIAFFTYKNPPKEHGLHEMGRDEAIEYVGTSLERGVIIPLYAAHFLFNSILSKGERSQLYNSTTPISQIATDEFPQLSFEGHIEHVTIPSRRIYTSSGSFKTAPIPLTVHQVDDVQGLNQFLYDHRDNFVQPRPARAPRYKPEPRPSYEYLEEVLGGEYYQHAASIISCFGEGMTGDVEYHDMLLNGTHY